MIEDDLGVKTGIFLIFLFLSAFFSSSETALTAISKIKLRGLLERNINGIETLIKIHKKKAKLITAILIGNNISNIAATAMATPILIVFFSSIGIKNYASALTLTTVTLTTILLIIGEITPKTLALKNPEKLSLLVAKPLDIFMIIMGPIISIFNGISKIIGKILGASSDVKHFLTEDEIKAAVKIGEEEGVLEKEEKEMIHSIFEFSETTVREIMTPRTDAICIEINTPLKSVIKTFRDYGHSRIPVYESQVDNIIGIMYAKDLLGMDLNKTTKTTKDLMRKPIFIPETTTIEKTLQELREAKLQMAIVVDEYGGTAGLITFEDIIEEIVGDVMDEFDKDGAPSCVELGDNHYLVDGKYNIYDLAQKINHPFPVDDEDYDTIGGFVLSKSAKFPKKGEEIISDDFKIIVKEVNKRRLVKLELIKLEPGTDTSTASRHY